jgi:hypothetical protein
MDISVPWAIALGVAGGLGVLVFLGARSVGSNALLPWLARRLAYLTAGGLIGFLAIGFPPAWPPLAFIGGILAISTVRDRRVHDTALLLAGFGGAWAVLLGWSIRNDLADPSVYGSPETFGWFLFGCGVLGAGLLVLIGQALAERRS